MTRAYVMTGRFLDSVALVALFGCAGVKQKQHPDAAAAAPAPPAPAAAPARGGSSSTGAGGTITPTGCIGQCTDFEPTASNPNPMFDQGVSSDVGSKFGNPSGAGPCVTEPEDGALYPNNWAPLRVRVPGTAAT